MDVLIVGVGIARDFNSPVSEECRIRTSLTPDQPTQALHSLTPVLIQQVFSYVEEMCCDPAMLARDENAGGPPTPIIQVELPRVVDEPKSLKQGRTGYHCIDHIVHRAVV